MRIVSVAAMAGLLALVTGCRDTSQARLRLVCEKVCACTAFDEQEACVSECTRFLEPEDLGETCYECVLESRTCFDIDTCERICDEDGDDPPPPVLVDAPPFTDAPF